MTPSTTIEELVGRVEAATGADREIDGLIWKACEEKPGDDWQLMGSGVWHRRDPDDYVAFDVPPKLTASIDAALALAERVLPGLSPGVSQNVHHGNWYAWFADGEQRADGQFTSTEVAEANHDFSAPLAIILATLKALSRIKGDHNDEA